MFSKPTEQVELGQLTEAPFDLHAFYDCQLRIYPMLCYFLMIYFGHKDGLEMKSGKLLSCIEGHKVLDD